MIPKICRDTSTFVKIGPKYRYTVRRDKYSVLIVFVTHLLQWEMSQTNFVEKIKAHVSFLISNFRLVLYTVCFLLGNSPASEFYMSTFRNTLFHLHRQVGAECRMLYAFFWVIPRRLNFKFRRFGTLCLFHLLRQVGAECRRLYAFFWVIPQRLNFICRRFGTLCPIFIGR